MHTDYIHATYINVIFSYYRFFTVSCHCTCVCWRDALKIANLCLPTFFPSPFPSPSLPHHPPILPLSLPSSLSPSLQHSTADEQLIQSALDCGPCDSHMTVFDGRSFSAATGNKIMVRWRREEWKEGGK